VQDITDDEGLTLLKIGISRILMLRALFSSKELPYVQRHKALVDAIITSHNAIIVHNQLIRFPDIAFFTSPIPLHIAAMVILYGHMSKCDVLPRHTALEDIWLALDMLPRFRWRWERKDSAGGHPLIAKLAERVMDVDFQQIRPITHPCLLPEPEWEEEEAVTPITAKSQQNTPTLAPASYAPGTANTSGGVAYPHSRPMNGGKNVKGGTPPDSQLAEVPTQLFYPFYPDHVTSMPLAQSGGSANGQQGGYTHLLAAAATQDNRFGLHPHADHFMPEEAPSPQHHMPVWGNALPQVQSSQKVQPYAGVP